MPEVTIGIKVEEVAVELTIAGGRISITPPQRSICNGQEDQPPGRRRLPEAAAISAERRSLRRIGTRRELRASAFEDVVIRRPRVRPAFIEDVPVGRDPGRLFCKASAGSGKAQAARILIPTSRRCNISAGSAPLVPEEPIAVENRGTIVACLPFSTRRYKPPPSGCLPVQDPNSPVWKPVDRRPCHVSSSAATPFRSRLPCGHAHGHLMPELR